MSGVIYYEGQKIEFALPAQWNVISNGQEIKQTQICQDGLAEVRRSLDSPIDSPPLEELASRAGRAVILFDDLTRMTPPGWLSRKS